MANSKISQLPLAGTVNDADLLAIVQDAGGGSLSTNKISVGSLKTGMNVGSGTVAGAESGVEIVSGKVYLGGTPLLRNTIISQNNNYLQFDDGAFVATGYRGVSPISGKARRMMWIPSYGAFRAGQVDNNYWDNENLGTFSVAMGFNTMANGAASFAMGVGSIATNYQSVAFGYYNNAYGQNAFVGGHYSTSAGNSSLAFGHSAQASGDFSLAIGDSINASGYAAVALGQYNNANYPMSFAFGKNSNAYNTLAFAFGEYCEATAPTAFAMGANSKSYGASSFSMGGNAKAYSDCAVAMGNEAEAHGKVSFSFGELTKSYGDCSLAVGNNSQSLMANSVALGYYAIANGFNAMSFGDHTEANGLASFASGFYSKADGNEAVAFGYNSWAKGNQSFAAGYTSVAEGSQSIAMGSSNNATGVSSVALGTQLQATYDESIALGCHSESHGRQSLAFGCHAIAGTSDHLNGQSAVALGDNVKALYDFSLAMGSFVEANASGAFVIGKGDTVTPLVNSIDNSLMIGFGSTVPTLFVSESPSLSASGSVGIGTSTPGAKLHVDGDFMLASGTAVNKISTDGTLSGNSDSTVPTEKAVKSYVDNFASSVVGGVVYVGTWDASANSPAISTAGSSNKGQYYRVSVAGSTNINGVTDWKVGDWIISNGSSWDKVDNTESIVSVNGQTGTVVLSSSDISEGTNLYFTNARSRSALSVLGTFITYNSTTGEISNSYNPVNKSGDTLTGNLVVPNLGVNSGGSVIDSNSNKLIAFPATVASAVNYLTVSNAATAGLPSISATGTDTNISINLVPKGTGTLKVNNVDVVTLSATQTLTGKTLTSPTLTTPKIANNGSINDSSGLKQLEFVLTASAVNYLRVANAATGGAPSFTAQGTDANVNLKFAAKGTGLIDLSSPVTLSATAGSGYLQFGTQSSAPAATAGTFKMYADSSTRLSWLNSAGFAATLDTSSITASRVLTIPDASGTIMLVPSASSGTNTPGTNNVITASAGTGNATPSYISLQTPSAGSSGTTTQTLTERVRITDTQVILNGQLKAKGLITAIATKTSNYTVTTDDHTILADSTSAQVTITIPSAVGLTGTQFTVKRINAGGNNVIVQGTGAELLDAGNTYYLSGQWSSLTLQSNGTQWFILSRY